MTSNLPSELLHCRPRLRADVRCHLQTSANQPYYQLEDPLLSRFYRLGQREWKLASQFTGSVTLADLLRTAPRESTQDTLSQPGRFLRLPSWHGAYSWFRRVGCC